MTTRLKVMLLLLGYLMFCSAFFGAVFTGYKTGDQFMFIIGLGFLLIAQLFAGVLIYMVKSTEL